MMDRTRLMENIASCMISHGEIHKHVSKSNEYTGVEIYELQWRGIDFQIVQVDGMTCVIEKI